VGEHDSEGVAAERRVTNLPMNKAVFLDRDGVINRPMVRAGYPYPPRSVSEFVILPGVEDACRALKKGGFLLVVVTNQPDVGRGTLERRVVEEINGYMGGLLPIDLVLTCFHGGEKYGQPCECRKPRPGMLQQAADQLKISLSQSYMVGDRWRDIDCGKRVGCKTVFIDWGYTEDLREPPDHRATNLLDAASIILRENG
jgi:D-glycero-D-manno-heptose 1,7-bisphosphate phosphatase